MRLLVLLKEYGPFPFNVKIDNDLYLVQEGYTIIPFNCVFEEGWEYEHAIILYHELKKMAD